MTERPRFEEIDVERINIIEADGTPRMTISNKDRTPELPQLVGTPLDRTGKRGAGMIFFNEAGVECGGLTTEGGTGNGDVHLSFDRFNQDQVVQLAYHEDARGFMTGLFLQDRPDEPLVDMLETGSDMDASSAPMRAALGRSLNGEVGLYLMDSKGRPRIRMCVEASDEPVLQFLDAEGNVTFSLPPQT